MGGIPNRFPSTRWSMILQAADRSLPGYQEAIGQLCRHYWKPAYAYIRAARSFDIEDAKDLTQEFFLEILEGGFLARFSPDTGSFRSYLRGALRLFLRSRHEKASAAKRGGGSRTFSLDTEEAKAVIVSSGEEPEAAFDRQWARSLLGLALEDLRRELAGTDKELHLRVFDRYELQASPGEPVTYPRLAQEFAVSEDEINVRIAFCRRRLRKLLIDRIRDYAASEGESATELERMVRLLTPAAR